MAHNEEKKKQEEQFFVDLFLSKTGLQYATEPSEAPDFRLHAESRIMGLEVTRLFYPAPNVRMSRRAVESLREDVLERARMLYENSNNPIVHVSVFFSSSTSFKKPRVISLARQLTDLVIRNMPSPNSHAEEEYDWINREWFPEEIDRIRVVRNQHLSNSHWGSPDAIYEPTCTVEMIQGVISKKAGRYEDYSKLVEECWLLLVLDDFRLSGSFQTPEAVIFHRYESPFSEVYLLKTFGGEVLHLNKL